jgi:hypothetical protein
MGEIDKTIKESSAKAKDGLPDFEAAIRIAVPDFDQREHEYQEKIIADIKDAMMKGIKQAFADDVDQYPEFIIDLLVGSLEMLFDHIEAFEREQWGQGGSGNREPPLDEACRPLAE